MMCYVPYLAGFRADGKIKARCCYSISRGKTYQEDLLADFICRPSHRPELPGIFCQPFVHQCINGDNTVQGMGFLYGFDRVLSFLLPLPCHAFLLPPMIANLRQADCVCAIDLFQSFSSPAARMRILITG